MEEINDNLKYLNELIQEVNSTAASRIPVPPAVGGDIRSGAADSVLLAGSASSVDTGATKLVLPELLVPYQSTTDASGVVEDRIEELDLESHTDAELEEEFKLVWEIRHQCSDCDLSESRSELAGLMKKNLYAKLFEQTEADLQVIHSEYTARGLPIPPPPAKPAAPEAEEAEEDLPSVKPTGKKGKKASSAKPVVLATAVDMETGEEVPRPL